MTGRLINKRILPALLLLLTVYASEGQPMVRTLLDNMKILGSPSLAYDYHVQLIDENGIVADSLRGKLYKSGRKYYDSSSAAMSISDGSYYCKLDMERKTAMICNIKKLEEQIGRSYDEDDGYIASIQDSTIARYGTLTVDTSVKNRYTLTLQLRGQTLSTVQMQVDRSSLRLLLLCFEFTEATEQPGVTIKKRCTLYRFSTHVPADQFNLSRILSIQPDKTVLTGKYAGYQLTTII